MYILCPSCHLPSTEHAALCPECATALAGLPRLAGGSLSGAVIEKRYQLMELLGEGSMSWVYRGIHSEIGSSVAVKLLKPAFAEDPGQLARFRKEAAAISSLSHPHILSVISSGETPSHIHYMVTEYIQGTTLAQVIETTGRLPLARSVDILRQILIALEEAHGKGIVHRDLKPENIMVIPLRTGEDFCKIVDFGIALRRVPDEQRLTRHGEIIGTPAFMAPEVIRGEEARVQSDLFSAGVIFYEMLTGALPWKKGSMFETLLAHLNEEPVPVRRKNSGVPARVERLLSMALVKAPEHRIPDATEFLRLLQFGAPPTIRVCATCLQPVLSEQKFCPTCGRLQDASGDDAGGAESAGVDSAVTARMAVPATAAPGPGRMFSIRFHGRNRELESFGAFLAGDAVCLEVHGEPGVGKGALVARALEQWADPGLRVERILPDPLEARRSWWPLRQLVSRLCSLPTAPEQVHVDKMCASLGLDPEDLPHVRHLFEVQTEPVDLENRVRQKEMVISVSRLVLHALRERRTLAVFFDADRYDAPSRAVLAQLVILCQGSPVRLVITSVTPVIQETGGPERSTLRLAVERFSPDDSWRFCQDQLDRSGTDATDSTRHLVSAAGGLPLHLIEGLRLLHEGLPNMDRPLSDIVQQRVRNLPGAAHRLLQWVAVAGGRIPVAFFRDSALFDAATLDAHLTCVRHGLLSAERDDELRLAHHSFRKIILAEIPTSLRVEMHRQLIDRLRLDVSDPRILCEHALQARLLEPAASYHERSGALCEDQFDDPGAVHHYRMAYELTEFGARQGRELQRFQNICIRYGDMLRYTGQHAEAVRVLQEALLCGNEEDAALAPILSSLARGLCQSTPEHATVLVQRAIKVASKSKKPQQLFRVYFDIGQIALQTRRFEEGLGWIRMGLSLLEGVRGLPDSIWRLHLQCAQCEAGTGRSDQAVATFLGTLERPEVANSWLAQARLHEELANLFIARREPQRAAERRQMALAALRFTGDRVTIVENELLLAKLDRENGKAWAESALGHALRIGFRAGADRARHLLKQA